MIAYETISGAAPSAVFIMMAAMVLLWLPVRLHIFSSNRSRLLAKRQVIVLDRGKNKSASGTLLPSSNSSLVSAQTSATANTTPPLSANNNQQRLHLFFYLSIIAGVLSLLCGLLSQSFWSQLILSSSGQLTATDNRLNVVAGQPDPSSALIILLGDTAAAGLAISAIFFAISWILKHPIWLYHSATASSSGASKALYQIDTSKQRTGKQWISNGIAIWAGSIWVLFLLVPSMMSMRLLPVNGAADTLKLVYRRLAVMRLLYASQLFLAAVMLLLIRRQLAQRWRSCWRVSKWIYLSSALLSLDCLASIILAVGWDLNLANGSASSLVNLPLMAQAMLALHTLCMVLGVSGLVELSISCVPPLLNQRSLLKRRTMSNRRTMMIDMSINSTSNSENSSRSQSLLFTPPRAEAVFAAPPPPLSPPPTASLNSTNNSRQQQQQSSCISMRRGMARDMRKSVLLKQTVQAVANTASTAVNPQSEAPTRPSSFTRTRRGELPVPANGRSSIIPEPLSTTAVTAARDSSNCPSIVSPIDIAPPDSLRSSMVGTAIPPPLPNKIAGDGQSRLAVMLAAHRSMPAQLRDSADYSTTDYDYSEFEAYYDDDDDDYEEEGDDYEKDDN